MDGRQRCFLLQMPAGRASWLPALAQAVALALVVQARIAHRHILWRRFGGHAKALIAPGAQVHQFAALAAKRAIDIAFLERRRAAAMGAGDSERGGGCGRIRHGEILNAVAVRCQALGVCIVATATSQATVQSST